MQAPPRKRRLVKGILTGFLALCFLFIGLYLFRVPLVNNLAPALLAKVGLDNVQLLAHELGLSRWAIKKLSFTKTMASGQLTFAFHEIECRFGLPRLISGAVDEVKIGHVDLTFPVQQGETSPASSGQEILPLDAIFSLADTLSTLPMHDLQVHELQLYAVQGEKNTKLPLLSLTYHSGAEGTIVQLTQKEQLAPERQSFAATLTLAGKKVLLTITAELEKMPEWLSLFAVEKSSGYVQAQLEMTSQTQQKGSHVITFSLQGKDVVFSAWQVKDAQLVVKAHDEPASGELTLGEGSMIGFSGLQGTGLQVEHVQMEFSGKLAKKGEHIFVNWQGPGAVNAENLQFGDISCAALQVQKPQLQLSYSHGGSADTKAPFSLLVGEGTHLFLKNVSGKTFSFSSLEADLAGLSMAGLPTKWHGRWQSPAVVGTLQLTGLQAGGILLAPLSLGAVQVEVQAQQDKMEADLSCFLPEAAARLKANYQAQTGQPGKGMLRIQSDGPILLTAEHSPLSLLQKPVLPINFNQGTLSFTTDIAWGGTLKSPQTQVEIDLKNAAAHMADLQLTGVNLQNHLQLTPQIRSLTEGNLTLQMLSGPVPIGPLTATFRLEPVQSGEWPALFLKKAAIALFQGQATLDNCQYDPNRKKNECSVQVKGFDLAKILELHKVEGLHATGVIDGVLPFVHNEKGWRISQGSAQSSPMGGVIQYHPASDALKNSSYSEFVFKALEDFQYKKLAAEVEYQPSGNLVIDVHLQGKSSQLETDRPVHFNVHTEQNLLSLLKSLQYSQGLTDKLESKVKKDYQLGRPTK